MSFIGQTISSTKDLLGSMTPAARVTTVALLGVIIVSSVFLFRVKTGEPDTYLFGGRVFSNRELDAMTTAFSKSELNEWSQEGNRVSVPRSQRHLYLAALADAKALPERFDGYLEDIISTSNPFQSRDQFATQKRYAVQRDLATIVRAMEGIDMATVKITETQDSEFSRNKRTTALVAARATGSNQLTPEQVDDIRAIVSRASGARDSDVTVSDLQGRTYSGTEGGGSYGNEYARAKRNYENEWRSKIEAQLGFVQGAVVGVDVTLNSVATTVSRAHTVSQPQPVRQENRTTKSMSRDMGRGGQPGSESNGVVPNAPVSVAGGAGGAVTSEETVQFDVTESAVSTEQTERAEIGLTPKFVSASILIPKSYIRRIWDDANPPDPNATPDPNQPQGPTEAELKQIEDNEAEKIRRMVDRLLPPIDDGSDKWPRIDVTSYVDVPVQEPPAVSPTQNAMGWLSGNWQVLAMLFAGLFALLLVRNGLSAQGAGPSDQVDVAGGPTAGGEAVNEAETELNILRLRRGDDTPSLKEELTDLVREDPDAAANVLSQWIANSG